MSKVTLVAAILSVGACALGYSAYRQASTAQSEVRALKQPRGEAKEEDLLAAEVSRLAARVDELERRGASAPRGGSPGTVAVAAAPTGAGTVPVEPELREARKQEVGSEVAAHWKAWGLKHGLNDQQADVLAGIEADAARSKLENQAKLVDGTLTQVETRANNQKLNESVRKRAKALLTPEQFAQFEADRGGDWGSSIRKVREAEAKSGPAAPAAPPSPTPPAAP